MYKKATFLFLNSLNDFLSAVKKQLPISYDFTGNPSVKDAIEAIGIPHTEVGIIKLYQKSIPFTYLLKDKDSFAVHPIELAIPNPTFILDVHLGKLARSLRMLGFDCFYQNNYTDAQIIEIAASRHRIVLTRDVNLLKHKALPAGYGYWLRSQYPDEQLTEVMMRYNLYLHIQPFLRCMNCNGMIQSVAKENIINQLEPKTKLYFHKFYQCNNCGKVYWEGSHHERMQRFVKDLRSKFLLKD